MDDLPPGVVAGVIGGVVGGLSVGLIALFQKPKKCPECGEELPKTRKPKNRRQMLWGGWTCENCGCEVDRKGNKIEERDEG